MNSVDILVADSSRSYPANKRGTLCTWMLIIFADSIYEGGLLYQWSVVMYIGHSLSLLVKVGRDNREDIRVSTLIERLK